MSEFVFIEQKPMQGAERPVESGTTIGREGCDITITDPDVSRRHAAIQIAAGELSIEDLGSTNGTHVNGVSITERHILRDGDEVQIGATIWRLRAPAGATRLSDVPDGATRMSQATTLRPSAEAAPAEPAAPDRTAVQSAPPGPAVPEEARPAAAAPSAPAASEPATEEARRPAAAPSAPAPASPPPSAPAPSPVPAASAAAPAPSTPAPSASAPPPSAAAPAPAGPASHRGDVPLPDFAPSAIRRIVPADAPTAFTPETQGGRKGSAATRGGATLFATVVVALTTVGVVLYYITEPFK